MVESGLRVIVNEYGITVAYMDSRGLSLAEASYIPLETPIKTKKDTLYFNRINVTPAMRGQGIGSILLKELLKNVKTLESALRCDVNPYGDLNYTQLFEWYKRHGFKVYSVGEQHELWYNL